MPCRSVLDQNVQQIFGVEPVPRCSDDCSFNPGILYEIGKEWIILFKRLTLGAVVITATGKDGDRAAHKVKPSELPIYGEPCKVCTPNPCSDEPGALECQIGVIRKELWIWNDKFKTLRQEVVDVCETGLRHTESNKNVFRSDHLAPDGSTKDPPATVTTKDGKFICANCECSCVLPATED